MRDAHLPTSTSKIKKLIKVTEVAPDVVLYPFAICHNTARFFGKPPFEFWQYPFTDDIFFYIVGSIGWTGGLAALILGFYQSQQDDKDDNGKGLINIINGYQLFLFSKNQLIVNIFFDPYEQSKKSPIFLAGPAFIFSAICDIGLALIDHHRAAQEYRHLAATDRLIDEASNTNEVTQNYYATLTHIGFKTLVLFGTIMNNLPTFLAYANSSQDLILSTSLWCLPVGTAATTIVMFYYFYKHRASISPCFFKPDVPRAEENLTEERSRLRSESAAI